MSTGNGCLEMLFTSHLSNLYVDTVRAPRKAILVNPNTSMSFYATDIDCSRNSTRYQTTHVAMPVRRKDNYASFLAIARLSAPVMDRNCWCAASLGVNARSQPTPEAAQTIIMTLRSTTTYPARRPATVRLTGPRARSAYLGTVDTSALFILSQGFDGSLLT